MKREALRIYQPEVVARSAVSRTEVREAGREMLEARSQEPASARSASAEVASIPGVNTHTFIEPRSRTLVQLPRLRTLPDTSHTTQDAGCFDSHF